MKKSARISISCGAVQTKKQQLEILANFDSLTGLANRAFFLRQMETWMSSSPNAKDAKVLFYVDLDGFKTVNDSFGHHIGDKLLLEVTKRIKEFLNSKAQICRFGGDEFLCFFNGISDPNTSLIIANHLVDILQQTYNIEQWTIDISASIGIAATYPIRNIDQTEPIGTIVMKADTALYVAKSRGKNNAVLFDESMLAENKRILNIANTLPKAIRNKELTLFYQAKVDRDASVVGFEGLIRWFLVTSWVLSHQMSLSSVAEKSGKIRAITDFVIEQVYKDIHQLLNRYDKCTMVSVNLSSHDLRMKV